MDALHIYAQEYWHDEAYIVGTQAALGALRNAIDAALETGRGKAELFVSDGEGYTVHVMAESDETMGKLCAPYTDEFALDKRNRFGPWNILLQEKKL